MRKARYQVQMGGVSGFPPNLAHRLGVNLEQSTVGTGGFRLVYDQTELQIDRGTTHDDEPEEVPSVWSTRQAPKSRNEDTGFRLVFDWETT